MIVCYVSDQGRRGTTSMGAGHHLPKCEEVSEFCLCFACQVFLAAMGGAVPLVQFVIHLYRTPETCVVSSSTCLLYIRDNFDASLGRLLQLCMSPAFRHVVSCTDLSCRS